MWQPGRATAVYAPGIFDGRVALVTGGGTGLGAETACALAFYGADVVVAGRTPESLETTVGSIEQLGRRALAVPTNIRSTEEVDALKDAAYERFGRVDFLINNAGGQYPAPPSKITDNGWRAVVDLNLHGTWNVISRFMGPMAEAGYGSIVNVVHIFSFDRGAPAFIHSGAARAGVVNLTKSLAPYLMNHGVTVNAFAPGVFATAGMVSGELEPLGRSASSFEDEMATQQTAVRLGTADEMAAVILFLCSPAARYVSGASVVADGASSQSNWVTLFDQATL